MSHSLLGAAASIPPDDHEFLAFRTWWRWLTREERAKLIRVSGFEVSDAELAGMVGVDPRSLRRWAGYQEVKALSQSRPSANTKWRGRTHHRLNQPQGDGFSNPADPYA